MFSNFRYGRSHFYNFPSFTRFSGARRVNSTTHLSFSDLQRRNKSLGHPPSLLHSFSAPLLSHTKIVTTWEIATDALPWAVAAANKWAVKKSAAYLESLSSFLPQFRWASFPASTCQSRRIKEKNLARQLLAQTRTTQTLCKKPHTHLSTCSIQHIVTFPAQLNRTLMTVILCSTLSLVSDFVWRHMCVLLFLHSTASDSLSTVDNVITCCFFDHVFMRCIPADTDRSQSTLQCRFQ